MERKVNHSNHSHHAAANLREQSRSRMTLVLVLTGSFMLVEVVGALYTGSLALLADAGHMLTDVASILLALLAFWFSSKPATPGKSFGYYRSEILAGLLNGVLLVGVSGVILFEAYRRLTHPPAVMSGPMLMVALIGLVVNLISIMLLGNLARQSVNVKAAYLEVLGDLVASVGVIIAGLVIMFTGWYVADPLISGAIGLMILPRTWLLLTECTNILMEGTPEHIDLPSLEQAMLQVTGVVAVHDVHVWTIASGMDAMSGHVVVELPALVNPVLSQITEIAQSDFGIQHTTIQVEQQECKSLGNGTCKTPSPKLG